MQNLRNSNNSPAKELQPAGTGKDFAALKIVHLVQHYMAGYTYQENYLPAAMAALGHEVSVIAGVDNPAFYDGAQHQPGDEATDDGVAVRYVKIRYKRLYTRISGLNELLKREKPDLIFVHGFVLARSFELLQYGRQYPGCLFCADTHETYLLAFNACFSGTVKDRVRRLLYFKLAYRLWRRYMERRYEKVFYVTPPRRTFAEKELGFSEEMLHPLWLGAQLETLPYVRKQALRAEVRSALGMPPDAKMIVLAGKLDEKKRPVELAEAFVRLNKRNWWLLYVGSMDESVRSRVAAACRDNERVRFTGFLPGERVLEHIAASDFAVYPGAHSVLWEQTVCLGIPAAFHEPEPGDAAHLSDPANPGAFFLKTGSADELFDMLNRFTRDEEAARRMGENARRYGERNLSYTQIAKDALDAVEKAAAARRTGSQPVSAR